MERVQRGEESVRSLSVPADGEEEDVGAVPEEVIDETGVGEGGRQAETAGEDGRDHGEDREAGLEVVVGVR